MKTDLPSTISQFSVRKQSDFHSIVELWETLSALDPSSMLDSVSAMCEDVTHQLRGLLKDTTRTCAWDANHVIV